MTETEDKMTFEETVILAHEISANAESYLHAALKLFQDPSKHKRPRAILLSILTTPIMIYIKASDFDIRKEIISSVCLALLTYLERDIPAEVGTVLDTWPEEFDAIQEHLSNVAKNKNNQTEKR